LLCLGLCATTAAAWAPPAWALESAPVVSKRATATLVSDTDTWSAGMPFRVALRLQLAPGWHTYWKNPGDAGAPPELTLDTPAGGIVGPIEWPAPRRLAEGQLMTYGYTDAVLLPVSVTLPEQPGPEQPGPATLVAHATWLVCKDICVPEEGTFRLDLPQGPPAPSAQGPLFAAHDRAVPRPSPWEVRISPDGALSASGDGISTATVADASFIPETAGQIQDDAAQPLTVRRGAFVISLKPASGFKPENTLPGVLSVRDQSGQQVDMAVRAEPGPPVPTTGMDLPRTLLFAFLGGLILNLMPCVFPVLAMKAVGLASGAAAGRARGHAVSYTAGVVVTFLALAVGLLAARAAGTAAGWGFQFQSPVFVAVMAWVLFAVGLNLSGVFQVGGALAGSGTGLASRHGHLGSFFTGLLAVLVATPCTAPFMGVAIAAGLTAPAVVTLLVFVAMGLGLAAPYVVLAAVPGLARALPRPGRWMDVFKQGLAFPMYGAAVWLLWVVSQEAGAAGVLTTATGFVLLGLAGWSFGVSQQAHTAGRRFGQTVAVAAVLATLAMLPGLAAAPPPGAARAEAGVEPFSPSLLAGLRAEGRPVFVNMTAAWCVTCLVNERVAISTSPVKQAFAARGIAYLKGDWTRQDAAITAYLRQHGRDGVPLYVYYPPNGAAPVVLPQILTEGTVLAALAAS